MQITLNEAEIMEAIYAYCAKQITLPVGSKYNVELIAGRAPAGSRAVIDIVSDTTPSTNTVKASAKEEAPDKAPDKTVDEPTNGKPEALPETSKMPELTEAPPWDEENQNALLTDPPAAEAEAQVTNPTKTAGVTLVEGKSLFDL